tara:strand:- start:49 stop:360 length:312 start_codon:yes stop_codon:yes gene_type:complete
MHEIREISEKMSKKWKKSDGKMSILSFRTAATCSKISENRFFRNFHKFSTKKKNFIIEYSPEVTKCTEFYKPEKFREISGKKHAKNTVFIEKSVKTVSFFGKR